MLQNPKVAFRDPELREFRIEKDGMNQPRPWAGAFAVVYKGIAPAGKPARAIRVFTTESPERRERYDLIHEYLKTRRLKCLVEFEYRDATIRAMDGKWYPVILMDWVEGLTLFNWARARAQAGDARELAKAAQHWVALVGELEDNQIAHGDLQHANVMITPAGEVKLVDYDCMCVPALVGRRNLEVGVEPYQHPGRNGETLLSPDLDHFSSLVVYVALRALAADPSLWLRYVEQSGHDKLLFRLEDFRAPDSSPLVNELRGGPDQEVRDLLEKLLQCTRMPIDQVPSLSKIADGYAQLEKMLIDKEYSAAVRWLNKRGRFRDAPKHLQPMIRHAYEHVCRKDAWAAFTKIPRKDREDYDRQLIAAWNEPLFAKLAGARAERPRLAQARRRIEIVDQVIALIGQAGEDLQLELEQQIAQLAIRLPPGYRHTQEARVQQAMRRVGAMSQFEAVAVRDPLDEPALASAWQDLVDTGCSGLIDPQWQPRAELAAERAPLIAALAELPAELPPDQRDRRILSIWRDEVLADCAQAAPWRPLYEMALRHRQLLRQLQTAVESRHAPTIIALADDPALAGYPLPGAWRTVIKAARQKAAAMARLEAVLRDGPRVDLLPHFDARLIRQYTDQFAPYQSQLSQWTQSEILPAENLGLGAAVGRASLVAADEPYPAYRVRWTWPQSRFSDECILCITQEEPLPGDDPTLVPAVFRLAVDRRTWEHGGGNRLIQVEPDWNGYYVAVWARVDLGFVQFYSHPLLLGKLQVRGASFWKRLLGRPPARNQEDQPNAPPLESNGNSQATEIGQDAHE
jgi:serine/threonine protein kinase